MLCFSLCLFPSLSLSGLGYCRDFVGSFGSIGNLAQQQYGYYGYGSNNQSNEDSEQGTKCLLLCDVALGKSYEAHQVEYMEECKAGTQSTKAIGSSQPDPAANLITPDGLLVPVGAPVPVPVPEDWSDKNQQYHCTSYNEFIMSVESRQQLA